ncbi:UNVERIFIED_CONTAM: 8-amino-7-oxononanoate synthase [Sesamum latifolium]|uniref:8-amino-7-oxononanoate synthase n=1 Tax=Sesamum latifolium TaxID=2727402 RepID=A0AAW2T8S1_9LAMI
MEVIGCSLWENWVEEALSKLESLKVLRSLRPIHLPNGVARRPTFVENWSSNPNQEFQVFDGPWDDNDAIYENVRDDDGVELTDGKLRKLIVFSGNDYMGLSSHPMIRSAASKACSSGTWNGSKRFCFDLWLAANLHMMIELLYFLMPNHASIIDGIRLAEKQGGAVAFVYRHCDMCHLDALLSNCPMKKRVVVTDSLFSMDGDFAPMAELAKLRKKHGFLFVIDDAHATFVCGKRGGGAAEMFNCETDVDICIGTLSKAAGCHGGFIACSKKWKLLIQSRGRSFIFSTSTPVPIAAASHAAVVVAKEEAWRRSVIWKRVQEFRALTGIPAESHIISIIVGSEHKALQASRHLLKLGFHITAIRPPTVPPKSCRLRITLTAAHTTDDLRKLTDALAQCVNFQEIEALSANCFPKL